MPLLKSQIIFVKKGSTRSFSHPFFDTHCMIFITFPIFYCASYPSFSNLLWLKKRIIICIFIQQEHKISRRFLHHWMCVIGLVCYKHFLKWIHGNFQALDKKEDVRERNLYLYISWSFVPLQIYYNKHKFKIKSAESDISLRLITTTWICSFLLQYPDLRADHTHRKGFKVWEVDLAVMQECVPDTIYKWLILKVGPLLL